MFSRIQDGDMTHGRTRRLVNTRFGRAFAVVYLAALPLGWGGFVLLMLGYSWAGVLFAIGGLGLTAAAFDLRWRDPSIIEREKQRRWPMSSSWPLPVGWRAAWGQVLLGREIPRAWMALRGKKVVDPPPRVPAKTRGKNATPTQR
jgi:hypothetical protein